MKDGPIDLQYEKNFEKILYAQSQNWRIDLSIIVENLQILNWNMHKELIQVRLYFCSLVPNSTWQNLHKCASEIEYHS